MPSVPASLTRRGFLAGLTFPALALAGPAGAKKLRGVFPIMSTPFTESKAVDYEDLVREVDFLERCGVQGMVWPQLASEYWLLTKEERMRGMETLARAAKGKKAALVLGVQAPNTGEMLEYARKAESLEPDALIAIPPKEAKNIDEFLNYYRALARLTRRPVFVQTSGGARNINPEVKYLVELAREFPNCAYVKEEYPPIFERMKELAAHKPPIRGIFSGNHGKGWTYEMRIGSDGTCPGAPLSDVYTAIWDLHESGRASEVREAFARLLLVLNIEQQIPGTFAYLMKRRGVFKTMVSRLKEVKLTPEAIQEIEYNFEGLKPYLKA